jgi:Protein of unknown function (DUF1186)
MSAEPIISKVFRKSVKISQKLGIMELTEIIAELENYSGTFPRLALERAIEQQEAITPRLLATLAEWKSKLEELSDRTQATNRSNF